MKIKYKYFATSYSLSVFYPNKKALFKELKDGEFGNEDVIVYDISSGNWNEDTIDNFQGIFLPENVLYVYKANDKKILMGDDLKDLYLNSCYVDISD